MISRGGQIGSIVKNGVTVCDQYEWFCMRHPKPVKMLKSISESFEKIALPKQGTDWEPGVLPASSLYEEKKLVVSGAHCPRCGNFQKEGDWFED